MIYLIRHGQTEYNIARRFQGSLDSPLTALGEAQARAMGARLKGLVDPEIVALFSSSRGRAVATARLIAEEAGITAPVILDDNLAEVSLGSWDGKTGPEIDAATNGHWSSLDQHNWFFETPDGERYEAFEARLGAALARVAAHPAPVRIIVSHGVSGRVLRGLHAKLPRAEMLALPVPQGVIYRFEPGRIVEIDCNDAIG
jgi:probable phosphoglycerate mutase